MSLMRFSCASGVALADFLFWNQMAARRNAILDARNVQLGGRQSAESDQDVVCLCGLQDLGRHRLAAECCFEGVVRALRDGLVKATHALLPCVRIRRLLVASCSGLELTSEHIGG
jgi:hypothetical protein